MEIDLEQLLQPLRDGLSTVARRLPSGKSSKDEIKRRIAEAAWGHPEFAPFSRAAVADAFASASDEVLRREFAAQVGKRAPQDLRPWIGDVLMLLASQAWVQILSVQDSEGRWNLEGAPLRSDCEEFLDAFVLLLDTANPDLEVDGLEGDVIVRVGGGASGVSFPERGPLYSTHRHAFAYVFAVLVAHVDELFGLKTPDDHALREIAILADNVLLDGSRIDIADRLAIARQRFEHRPLEPEVHATVTKFLAHMDQSTTYLKFHRARVELSVDPRSDRSLKSAHRIVLRALGMSGRRAPSAAGASDNPAARDLEARARAAVWRRVEKLAPSGVRAAVRFPTLFRLESAWLTPPNDAWKAAKVPLPSTTREPRVAFPDRDYFGLALSGGGIRSATFNLGLLQGLAEKGVLDHVHYVSTASGGGYIGGFWTAWRRRQGTMFPPPSFEPTRTSREHPSVRHMREFSRFLVPRLGFMQTETWNAIVAWLGGMIASLLFTFAAVAVVLWASLVLVCVAGFFPPHWVALALFALTCSVHWLDEWRLRRRLYRLGDDAYAKKRTSLVSPILGGILAGLGWLAVAKLKWIDPLRIDPSYGWAEFNKFARERATSCAYRLALAWALGVLVLLLVRSLGSRLPKTGGWLSLGAAIDRTAGRAIRLALASLVLGLLVWGAQWCSKQAGLAALPSPLRPAAGPITLFTFSAVLFAWLRDWLNKPVTETYGSKAFARLVTFLKPVTPQVVAWVATVALFVAVMTIVRFGGFACDRHGEFTCDGLFACDDLRACGGWDTFPGHWSHWRPDHFDTGATYALCAFIFVVLAIVLFDPARVGLHEYYRNRISRCFLGASTLPEPYSKDEARRYTTTTEQPTDDLSLEDLRSTRRIARMSPQNGQTETHNPIHLVCCAANNLAGDVLGSLYRGARSAVVSQFGVSVGDYSGPNDDLSLSAGLTASAAAFNSQMGFYSIKLGPEVAFLMCALNLRLGLWVPHPLEPVRKRKTNPFPGWFFILEALGWSRSDQVADEEFTKPKRRLFSRKLHLSDGGHFENLGLYELVRRHCRYVIVSDVGDELLHFDDLGNAVRRVREDFGVEIEIDLSPLRPGADGFASQHAVVGTIHYDGLDGTDKGLLIYFTPALTGDEPPDIVEHRARNPHFPHDPIVNQFYNEAQWESYRRLGKHTASAVLGLPTTNSADFVDELFFLATQRWYPARRDQDEVFEKLNERCASLEQSLPDSIRNELFPEVALAGVRQPPRSEQDPEAVQVQHLLLAIQFMEDVWLTSDLEASSSHPLNQKWIRYFDRWTSMPSFRRWWPILSPIFNARFGDFVRDQFDLSLEPSLSRPGVPSGRQAYVEVCDARRDVLLQDAGPAMARWLAQVDESLEFLQCRVQLESSGSAPPTTLVIGALAYSLEPGVTASWKVEDLYLPLALQGGGFTRRFLNGIEQQLERRVRELRVVLRDEEENGEEEPSDRATVDLPPVPRRPRILSPAERDKLIQAITLYKSHGFDYPSVGECDEETLAPPADELVKTVVGPSVLPQRLDLLVEIVV